MDNMTITSAQYVNKNGDNICVRAVIDGETMSVPLDPANRHYAAIKAKHDDADDSFTIQDAS
jgi:hypothetical protein